MASLPPLHALHLGRNRGARTGVALTLRPVGDPDTASRGKAVGGFATTSEVSDKLGGLIRDLETNPAFVHRWRVAICTNLKNKHENYTGQVVDMYSEIVREQELQRRLVNAARRPLEVLKGEPVEKAKVPKWLGEDGGWSNTAGAAPVDKEQRRENSALVDMAASKNQILGEDGLKRWRALNLKVEAIAKLEDVIVERWRAITTEEGWRRAVSRFVNQVRKLRDYPEALAMIEKLVDLVRAFVAQPTIAGSQFFNVMIMGVAGTGKTRLAGILGNILAQLGMYVYDELVESSVGDFIAGFEGQTEDKVVSFLTNNAEKVIFLDEAYALTKWDRDHTHLDGYSPEAVAELIAFLSKNVGKIAFIAAGYEDKMVHDFLAANEGFERRFPIRVTLGSYTNPTLYNIFIKALALTYFPPEPKDRTKLLQWETEVQGQVDRCYAWFRDEAVLVLYAVIDASKGKYEEGGGGGAGAGGRGKRRLPVPARGLGGRRAPALLVPAPRQDVHGAGGRHDQPGGRGVGAAHLQQGREPAGHRGERRPARHVRHPADDDRHHLYRHNQRLSRPRCGARRAHRGAAGAHVCQRAGPGADRQMDRPERNHVARKAFRRPRSSAKAPAAV